MPKAKAAKPIPVTSTITARTAPPLSFPLAFWGLMAILFVSPYLRGLFFASEQYWALVLAAGLFFLVWVGKVATYDNKMFEHPLDYLMPALPAVYLFSAFFAVNTGAAVNEVVRALLYFLAFWIAARVITTARDLHQVFHVIYLSAVGVALAGLAAATGIIQIKDGFLDGRIFSTFQYANALANYLLAVLFLGTYLWQRRVLDPALPGKKPSGGEGLPAWLRFDPYPYYYALGNFLLLAVFFGTKSHGGFAVFAVLLPLFLFGLPAPRRFPVFSHLVLTAAPAAAAIVLFLRAASAEQFELAWLWVLGGLALAGLGQFLWAILRCAPLGAKLEARGATVVPAGLGLILTGAAVAVALNWERLQAFLKLYNLEHRLYYNSAAWDMVLARPLTGWGGGGWQEAYQAFLPFFSTTRQVHGHYLQVGVETGLPGMALFLGIWGVFFWAAWRLYRSIPAAKNPAESTLVWTVILAALAIGLHSALDFNFSLGALALVAWVLFGAVVGLDREAKAAAAAAEAQRRKKRKQSSYVPQNYSLLTVVAVCAGLTVCGVVFLSAAQSKAVEGTVLVQQGQTKDGIKALERAAAYNPFGADYNYLLAQVYHSRGDKGAALAEIERAVRKSRYNPAYYEFRAHVLNAMGDYEAAAASAEEALTKAPLAITGYEALVRTYFVAGYEQVRGDDPEAAREYFEAVAAVPGRIEAVMAGVSVAHRVHWSGPQLQITGGMQFPLGVSRYFLGQFEEAAAALEAAAGTENEQVRGEVLVWLAAVAAAGGDAGREVELLEEAEKLFPEALQLYAWLKSLPIPKTE